MKTKKDWLKWRLERQTDDVSDSKRTCVYLHQSRVYIYTLPTIFQYETTFSTCLC